MKKHLYFYRLASPLFLLCFLLLLPSQSYAKEDGGDPRTVGVMVGDSHHNAHIWQGEKAPQVIELMDQGVSVDEILRIIPDDNETQTLLKSIDDGSMTIEDTPDVSTPTSDRKPRSVSYHHRFVTESEGEKFGPSQRICDELYNYSSIPQSYSVSIGTSISHTISPSLSGKFLDAFEASIKIGKTKTLSFKKTITVNVAPRKKTWVEFAPKYHFIKGKAQKYFIPRGPINKKPVVVETKKIYAELPVPDTISIAGKTFPGPSGRIIWRDADL